MGLSHGMESSGEDQLFNFNFHSNFRSLERNDEIWTTKDRKSTKSNPPDQNFRSNRMNPLEASPTAQSAPHSGGVFAVEMGADCD